MTTCDWQLPRGSQLLCGAQTHLLVDRIDNEPPDTPMPLCAVHLVDYIAIHGPQRVEISQIM